MPCKKKNKAMPLSQFDGNIPSEPSQFFTDNGSLMQFSCKLLSNLWEFTQIEYLVCHKFANQTIKPPAKNFVEMTVCPLKINSWWLAMKIWYLLKILKTNSILITSYLKTIHTQETKVHYSLSCSKKVINLSKSSSAKMSFWIS